MIIPPPNWATILVAEYAPDYQLIWEITSDYTTKGFCYEEKKEILIKTPPHKKKTKVQLFVLLHEIVHTMEGKNHDLEFYERAAQLYAFHGILAFAAEREYPEGREILKEKLKERKK